MLALERPLCFERKGAQRKQIALERGGVWEFLRQRGVDQLRPSEVKFFFRITILHASKTFCTLPVSVAHVR